MSLLTSAAYVQEKIASHLYKIARDSYFWRAGGAVGRPLRVTQDQTP